MAALQLNPDFAIDDEQSLRELFEPTHSLALLKCQESLGEHAREFIRRSPFLCIGSQHPDGKADVSPRGDPPGFVKVLDERTIAIPDRPGNNRLDTLANIVANPNVGLLFVIPGFEDTLRINGQAALTRDPEILKDMAVAGRVPKLAIIVSVSEAFLHCAKAFRRSRLWSADHFQDRSEMPSLIKMILEETTGAPTDQNEMRTMDEGLEEDYQRTLY
ncbi:MULTISPECIES: pyridoxamine 5'-phosphate oxidase family protein [unclassified Rhizobium]|uniref:pyridoxamine 5'-phosphate oxidase family protein n=1 Tax=unclassified Rhizobium TaxID=2613769 RepID=UPI00084C7F46|nr:MULTISPECIES: pyridoxamine 5'-phosphate oxidase family protein [unclassified Rhizobium]OEC97358.1 pyridoxamine 5'-phosphate oxidase [Rhizobium sp. YK2]QYA13987.1 pyridoxamine 5'-phosphate oxidase family protein [Rhizobium sp. AB2/73]UEQ80082.1 pyridoxamine 5'-phosphate oxidase family protein [Rhizobium sp. AB2/73]